MKISLIGIVFILFTLNLSAQDKIGTKTSNKGIFTGIENPLEIFINGEKAKDIIVKVNNGSIKGENGDYILIPDKTGPLYVKIYNNKDSLIFTRKLNVNEIPASVISIAGKTSGEISKNEILEAQRIFVKDFNDNELNAKRFYYSITDVAIERENNTLFFDTSFTILINKAKTNAKLFILVDYKENVYSKMPSATFIIK